MPLADQQPETLVQHLQANHAQLYAGLAEIMSDVNFSGLVPAHLLESTAGQLGVSTEQARDTLAYVAREFQQQAIRYISDQGIDYQSLQNWLKSDAGADKETRELLAKAMKAHSQDRSLDGYDLVISRILATLAHDHTEALMSQLEGLANIRKDPIDGRRAGGHPRDGRDVLRGRRPPGLAQDPPCDQGCSRPLLEPATGRV